MQIILTEVGCFCNRYLNMWKQLQNIAIGRGQNVLARKVDGKGDLVRSQVEADSL